MQLDVTRVHVPPLAIHANPLLARFDADTLRYGSAVVASENRESMIGTVLMAKYR